MAGLIDYMSFVNASKPDYTPGMKFLNEAISDTYSRNTAAEKLAYERKRQEEADRMAKAKYDMEMQAAKQKWDDDQTYRQTLQDVAKPMTNTVTTQGEAKPDFSNPEWLASHNYGALAAAQLPETITKSGSRSGRIPETQIPNPAIAPEERQDFNVANALPPMGALPAPVTTTTAAPKLSYAQREIKAGEALLEKGVPRGQELIDKGRKTILDEAKTFLALGDGESAVKFVNDGLGLNLKHIGDKGDMAVAQGKHGTFLYNKTSMAKDIQAGMSVADAWAKNAVQIDEKDLKMWKQLPDVTIDGQTAKVQEESSTGERKYEKFGRERVVGGVGSPKEKSLSSSDIEKLEERRNSKDLLSTLKTSYSPSFRPTAGKYTLSNSIGELETQIEKSLGNNPAATNWWQQYFEWANKELKKQSGAAVTPPEYKRFLQESIGTAGDPKNVTAFLERREKRATENYNQMADGLGVGRERAVSTYKESGAAQKMPAGAKSITGPKGQKGYALGGKYYTLDGKEIK
jgi:hypothetical protein